MTEPIENPYSPKPVGAMFKVDYIDDMLLLHGKWLEPERGSLAVSIEKDSFEIVK